MSLRTLGTRFVVGLSVMAVCVVFHRTSPAAKSGSIAPAPGTIFYQSGSFSSMNAMAVEKTALPPVGWPSLPTWQRHGGTRWFLENNYGAGIPGDWGQWFAVDGAGNRVQLTSDPDLHINGTPPTWARDDSFFSWCGVYETADEWIGRLFVASVTWTNGLPTAGPPTVVFEIRRPIYDQWGQYSYDGYDEVNLGRHDWSPSGDEAVMSRWVWGEGWVLDLSTFTESGVTTRRLTYGVDPEWSPNGSRIAFGRRDVWTIKPDGTGIFQLTSYSSSRGTERQQFSPTGRRTASSLHSTRPLRKARPRGTS